MGKRKVLFLIPSLVGGGAERALINILKNVNYDRFQIDLAVVSFNGIYKNEVPKQVKVIPLFKNDFYVRVLAYFQKKTDFSFFFRWKIRYKIKGSYDVTISYVDSNFTDLLFYIKDPGRLVSWVHASYKSYSNFGKFYENNRYKERLKLKRYSKLDAIVFVSNDAKQEFIEIFGTYPNMHVVYNHIDIEGLHKKSNEFISERNTEKLQFVAIGSLYPVKGYDKLIKASHLVQKKGYNFEVLILGKGYLEKYLEKLIRQYRLEEKVKLIGFQKNPYPYLKSADVFIMTSVSEALPVALSEAMVLGKPTLVTDCSGCSELVNNGEFGLFAEQTPESLAVKMIEYMVEEGTLEYFSNKSIERAQLFDDQIVLGQYYDIMDGKF